MNTKLILYMIAMLSATFISSIAQVILKKAATKKFCSKLGEYINPYVMTAYTIFFGATFINIYAYRVVPLSMGALLETTSYIYVTIFGVTVFKETINKRKMISLILILIGIVIYTLG